MKRTKNTEPLRWRQTGGGSFYLRTGGKTRIIKPGQVFSASIEDIPQAFRDTIVPVDGKALVEAEKQNLPEPAKLEYSVKHLGGGWYDVLSSAGKNQNESSLRKEDAEELLKSLQ